MIQIFKEILWFQTTNKIENYFQQINTLYLVAISMFSEVMY